MENRAEVDPAFRGISKTSSAFLIWRVENLRIAPLPKDQYGIFYDGDSYIVYAAYERGKHVGPGDKPKEVKGHLEMHIHFWLGKETSQDERAVAAIKTVELDGYLGSAPAQHREAMGCESLRFRAYFKHRLRIMKGGIATGLRNVNNNNDTEPRLFHVKGRRCPVVYQMPSISWQYFNSRDVFIVDTKDVVFVWIGSKSNSIEKLQATKVAMQLKSEHNAISIVFIDEGKEAELLEGEKMLLGVYLDLNPVAKRKLGESMEDDKKFEEELRNALRLYKCTDADGTYKVIEIKTGPLVQSDLEEDDAYIVDNGPYHIWVWVGKKASHKERVEALRNALGFMKKKNYPEDTKLSRIIDGGEPMEFKALFQTWREKEKLKINSNKTNGYIAKSMISTLANPQIAAQEQLIDEGTGPFSVWLLNKTELVPIPTVANNIFYSDESFVIKYTYNQKEEPRNILYYWLGGNATSNNQSPAALLKQSHENSKENFPIQIQLTQGREPPHFLAMFQGKFVTMLGKHKNALPKRFLLHVQGNCIYNAKATQVECKASSLDSIGVFLLCTNSTVYVWCGKGSTGDEREVAKTLAQGLVGKEHELYYEGQEKDEFWTILGGKELYNREKRVPDHKIDKEVRLFQCSTSTGQFQVEEIMYFSQSDLLPDDIMLLDAIHTIFVWIGNRATQEERIKSLHFASEYLIRDPSERDKTLPLVQIEQGYEPPNFTGYFKSWDSSIWKKEESFQEVREEINRQKPKLQVELKQRNELQDFLNCKKYPLKDLLEKDPEKLPLDVDVSRKEMYLSEKEFSTVFGMNHTQFFTFPKWRQENLKKSVGLF